MPKHRKKDAKRKEVDTEAADDFDDSASLISLHSEESVDCAAGSSDSADDKVDEASAEELFEDKVKESIDGLLEKSVNSRMKHLQTLCSCLRKKMCGEFLASRRDTSTEALEKCLRRGGMPEQQLAATALSLLCLQNKWRRINIHRIHEGHDDLLLSSDAQVIFDQSRAALKTLLLDNSTKASARASIARCISLCHVLAMQNEADVVDTMDTLNSVFSKSFLKGDGSAPQLPVDEAQMHAAALQGWSLLLSHAPVHIVIANADSVLSGLPELLESNCVELRIAAGEAIALLYEILRKRDEDFVSSREDELLDRLHELATESSKSKAKRDKKAQKSCFRDVLRFIESDDSSPLRVKFGSEVLELETWADRRLYSELRFALATGLLKHLQENQVVRDFFDLGAPKLAQPTTDGASRYERHLYNSAVDRLRTQHRNKNRDKRTATFE